VATSQAAAEPALCLPYEDSDTARGLARRMRYLNVPVYAAFHEWLGRGDLLRGMWSAWQAGDRKAAVAAVPDVVVDDLFVHGPVGACREQIEAYREAGVTTPVLFVVPLGDPGAAVRELAPG
jgi:hypothetical protein